MAEREWLIEVRANDDLHRLGVVDDFSQLEIVARFNAVGAWTLAVPAVGAAAAMLSWGHGIVVSADGQEVFSGPVGQLERVWDAGRDTLQVSGPDDLVWLQRRLAYPEAPALTTATDAHDVRTGVCSTVLREYVDVNAGPGAHTTRRVDGLTVGGDPVLGGTVTGRARFDVLLDLLASLALAGGDHGFRIVQEDGSLVFRVYAPADLTGTAVFSSDLGNLAAFDYREDMPSTNFVVVAGGDELTARVFRQGGDSASITRYGRIESFVDRRDTVVVAELTQAQDEALMEGAERTALSLSPVDTGGLRYLDDYSVGDRVRVEVDGTPVDDVVREVRIELGDAGEVVTPIVGSPGERDPRVLRMFGRMAHLERRLRDLERRP